MKLSKQTAVITGGGRGIGKEIALTFAREGANVVVCGRQLDVINNTAQLAATLGVESLALVTDVSDEAQVEELFAQVFGKFGRIDVLVNNAGITGPTAPVQHVSLKDWQEVLDVNLNGAFLCSRAVIPHLIEQNSGKIINIASIAGKMAYALRSPYSASKWGMIGLSRTLALELGPYNVQVNAICPGPTDGDRMKGVIAGRARELGRPEEEIEQLYVAGTALKRMVDPGHVAATALFLASAEGDSITGEAIDVSAGYAL